MESLPLDTQARHVDGFRIRLTFNDGLEAVVDFEDWLTGPIFEPLKDPDTFQRFFLEAGAIGWPNGADIAPGCSMNPRRPAARFSSRLQRPVHRSRRRPAADAQGRYADGA